MINPQNPSAAAWRIVAVEDYNRDGFVDLIFQYKDPASGNNGNLVVWYMDGITLKAQLPLSPNNPGSGLNAAAPR